MGAVALVDDLVLATGPERGFRELPDSMSDESTGRISFLSCIEPKLPVPA